jgi:hypothetical protein
MYTKSTIMPFSTSSWSVTGWKLVMTDWPPARFTRRARTRGCIGPFAREESRPIFNPYVVAAWINDVVYRIQRNPRSRMMVVHLGCLASYQGTSGRAALRKEQLESIHPEQVRSELLVGELDNRWSWVDVICCYEKLVAEAGTVWEPIGKGPSAVESRYQAMTSEDCNRPRSPNVSCSDLWST